MTEENINFFSYFDQTYAQQRYFLYKSQTTTIAEIRNEWTHLTNNKSAIFRHFQILMNIDIKSIQLMPKAQKLVEYCSGKTKITEGCDNVNDILLRAVKYTAKYFNVDIKYIIYEYKVM